MVSRAAWVERGGEEPPAIDRGHLARMTGGNAALEREVLGLFAGQSALLTQRMREAEPAAVAALAHTLKGAALGVGAHAVAEAADRVERAGPDREAALRRLEPVVARACEAVAAMLAPAPE